MSKNSATSNPEIIDLDIEAIAIHPYQKLIRSFSPKYATYVDEEAVDQYAENMKTFGYDRAHPIIVRVTDDGVYQCVAGWQRRTAMKSNGEKKIPAVVRDMTEAEAAMDLILKQGKEIGTWGKAKHAYKVIVEDKLMTQADYGRTVNTARNTVNEWLGAVGVLVAQANDPENPSNPSPYFSVAIAREIATAPKGDWKLLTDLALEGQWTKTTLEKVVKAFQRINIPEEFEKWHDPVVQKREIARNIGNLDDDLRLDILVQNITDAKNYLEKLPEERTVWEFENKMPKAVTKNLKQKFVSLLVENKPTTRSQVSDCYNKTLEWVKTFDDKYQKWEMERKTKEEREKAEEAIVYERAKLQVEYTPLGLNKPIDRLDLDSDFDVCFIHYPSSEENIAWPRVVGDALKPGGLLVALCESGDDLLFLADEVCRAELNYLELRPWIYPANETAERFVENTGYIAVYVKDVEFPYLPDPGILTKRHGAGAAGNGIAFLKGLDKKEVYTKLIPYLLDCYAQPEAKIFCPCVQDGAIVSAAKAAPEMAYRIVWSALEVGVFNRVSKDVEEAPFYWES